MKFTLIAAIAALLVASFVSASPVRVFGAVRNVQANDATLTGRAPEGLTNAQRMARGLPPMKPRSLSTSPTAAKRQTSAVPPGGRRRRSFEDEEATPVERRQTSAVPPGGRRSVPRMQKRDRYAGVYAQ
ncbi:uncharacterized protein SCHCODRAFT_02585479 [Schizophyllum commune H4-8]|uniref:Uncharacterized protein n=1 Tax=Schizophyllum commune (strain H4-8 / FGSC 9210) TaxID=578458 RepID=D8QBR9_SCHCM|nr:uncharacterized protein SCHCODRAFT_02585479 [Schizophyllum commune H4-8]KAI5889287.1 hypothetical protein SCHCODRAFT_02585479 [Schizophyllum commune H4-8]